MPHQVFTCRTLDGQLQLGYGTPGSKRSSDGRRSQLYRLLGNFSSTGFSMVYISGQVLLQVCKDEVWKDIAAYSPCLSVAQLFPTRELGGKPFFLIAGSWHQL